MSREQTPLTILMADDDPEDRMFAREAFEHGGLRNDLRFVENGEELIDYLRGQGAFAGPGSAPCPSLILLDLKMPRMDGFEVLREVKSDPDLRRIPIVVLTTSKAEEDVCRSYNLGANSFITKSAALEGLIDAIMTLKHYWLEIVALPPQRGYD